jgi:hypothetical protein
LWECQAKTAFCTQINFSLSKLTQTALPPSQREGDLGAVLRTAAAKGYRLLKPIV